MHRGLKALDQMRGSGGLAAGSRAPRQRSSAAPQGQRQRARHTQRAPLLPPLRVWSPSSAAGTTSSGSADARQQQQQQAERVREFLAEALDVALATGPRGLGRGLQAAQAVASLAAEYATGGAPLSDPPQRVLRRVFEKLGATYIKLGQFVASTPSLFGDDYSREFEALLDRAEPVPWARVRPEIVAALNGRPLEEVFESIDERPLASASIAQVHAAVLRGSRKEVVIKVVKPGAADVIAADLAAVYLAARALELLQPELRRLSLGPVLAQLRASMAAETDLRNEARHLAAFCDFLDRSGLRGAATAPYLYRQFCSER